MTDELVIDIISSVRRLQANDHASNNPDHGLGYLRLEGLRARILDKVVTEYLDFMEFLRN